MDKVQDDAQRARLLHIEELYRSGLTLKQVGSQLDPPLTAQRTGQLLRQGAELGLYLLPERHRDRQSRLERRLTDIQVRAALIATQRVEQAANDLGITKTALQTRFGHVVADVRAEHRKERARQAVTQAYRELAQRLGYEPNTQQMPRSLRHASSITSAPPAASTRPSVQTPTTGAGAPDGSDGSALSTILRDWYNAWQWGGLPLQSHEALLVERRSDGIVGVGSRPAVAHAKQDPPPGRAPSTRFA